MGKILSISKLKQECLQHEFDNGGNGAMNRGSLIHRCIENGGVFDNVINYKGFKRTIEFNPEDVDGIVAIAKNVIKKYVKEGGRQESIIQMDLNNDYTIEGIMDYVEFDEENNTATIYDWKSGTSGVYNNTNKKSMLQAYVYPMMVFERYKFIKFITFKYIFVDENNAEVTVEHTRDEYEANVEGVKTWVIKTYNALTTVAGEHCSSCKRMKTCVYTDTYKKNVELEVINNVTDLALTNDIEYKKLSGYVKIAEKLLEMYKASKENDTDYWSYRTNNDNQLVSKGLYDGAEALDVIEALSKDGKIKLSKAQYETLLSSHPHLVTTSSYKCKVFKLKK